MNDQLFDLVCDYLDQQIDDATWQSALSEHGDALLQLLKEEQAIRNAVSAIPQSPLPESLRQQLQHIPQQKTVKPKPSLFFPIFNSVAALAACLLITVLAIYSSNVDSDHSSENSIGKLDSEEQESGASSLRDSNPRAGAAVEKAAAPIPGSSESLKGTSVSMQLAPAEAEVVKKELARSEMDAGMNIDIIVEDAPEMNQNLRKSSTPMEAAAPPVTLAGEESKGQRGMQPAADAMVSTGQRKSADAAIGADTDNATDKAAAVAPVAMADDQGMEGSKGNKDAGFAAAASTAPVKNIEAEETLADEDIQLALTEARDNMKNNHKVREAVAKSRTAKTEKPAQETVIEGMIAANKQMLGDALVEQELDPTQAPDLKLKLAATAAAKYLDLQIEMNGDIDGAWINKAIIDLQLLGLNQAQEIIWRSPIVTHQVNEDIIELHSKDLPPDTVKTIVLESLQQRSAPINYPIK